MFFEFICVGGEAGQLEYSLNKEKEKDKEKDKDKDKMNETEILVKKNSNLIDKQVTILN